MQNPNILVPLVGLLVLVVPGLLLQLAAGVRDKLWLAALTPPLSVGVCVVAGTASAIPSLDYTPLLVAVVVVVLGALAAVAGRWLRGRAARLDTAAAAAEPVPPAFLPSLSSRATLLAKLAAAVMCLAAVVLALESWRSGLGSWSSYPQEHDTIVHTVLVSYIMRTGAGAPWELMPLDLMTGAPVSFYPSGLPLTAAVTGELGVGPIAGFNAVLALSVGPMFVLGCAALAAAIFRRMRAQAAWSALAGGLAAVVAAGLYAPGVNLLHDGGIAPNAVAMGLAPGVIAAFITIGRGQWLRAVLLGIAVAGIFAVHPSVAATVGCSVIVFWLVQACTADGRTVLRAQWPVLLAVGLVAALAGIGYLLGSLVKADTVGGWAANIAGGPLGDAVGNNLMLTYGGYFDPNQQLAQVAAALLALGGVAAVLITRRGWTVLAMWLFWLVVAVSFKVNPNDGFGALVASVFYKSYVRIQAHLYLFVPVLAAIGVVFFSALLVGLVSRWNLPRLEPVLRARGIVVGVLVVLVSVGYVLGAGIQYEHRNAEAVASRYAKPQFLRVDEDDRRASAWLNRHVEPGHRVMNSANDGSTYAYVKYGVPVVNVTTLGVAQAPYTYKLLKSFNEYPTNARVRSRIRALDITYVYVDSKAPTIGAGPGAPSNWLGEPTFRKAPGLRNLKSLPGMSVAFRSGSVTIYKLNQEKLRELGA